MALKLNKSFLAGNLTRDPEIKTLGESTVCNFTIASNRTYTSKGEKKEEVAFVDVEAWGRTAELVGQYLKKGSGCLVEARIKQDVWEDKEGNKRSKLKLLADNVQFTDAKPAGSGADAPPMHSQSAASNASALDYNPSEEDPPF